mmetsp:Transcript_24279/g.51599  ORF Transcript_24279/g.51599 Transcript_24279/m.51599 type:complete len:109 (+) Transcript_24279:202-528(+)
MRQQGRFDHCWLGDFRYSHGVAPTQGSRQRIQNDCVVRRAWLFFTVEIEILPRRIVSEYGDCFHSVFVDYLQQSYCNELLNSVIILFIKDLDEQFFRLIGAIDRRLVT